MSKDIIELQDKWLAQRNRAESAEARADKLAERVKVLEDALLIAQEADDFHCNCPDCQGEEQAELCGTCFPFVDKARLARRHALGIGANVVNLRRASAFLRSRFQENMALDKQKARPPGNGDGP